MQKKLAQDGPFQVDPVDPTGQLELETSRLWTDHDRPSTPSTRSTSNPLGQVPAPHLLEDWLVPATLHLP